MMYKCKVLTDEFAKKLEAYLSSASNSRDPNVRREQISKRRRALYYMWNNPTAFADRPEVIQYYEKLGLGKPQYREMSFLAVGKGFQLSPPSITWVNEIKGIAEISEIFSYELVN